MQIVEQAAAKIQLPDSGSEDEEDGEEGQDTGKGGEASLSDGVGPSEQGDEGSSIPAAHKPSGAFPIRPTTYARSVVSI
jgi:hypothetical protein